jgi:cytochrome P450
MPTPLHFDPTSAAFAANPYAVYERLQDQDAPLYWPDLDMVMVSRYADVSQIAVNPAMVRSLKGHCSDVDLEEETRKSGFADMPYHARFVQSNLLDTDGAEHGRLRRLIFGAFTARGLKGLEGDIHDYVERLLDGIPQGESFDCIEKIAAPLPGVIIGRFLGVPEEDAPQLRLWSEQIVSYYDIDKTPAKKAIAETAVKEFHDYLILLKNERHHGPQDDMISRMIAQETEGLFHKDELISTCMLILMAGHGSTIDVIGTGLHSLLKHPVAMRELRADPSLWPTAIEEMFRYEPPLPFFHRHATDAVTLRGHVFPTGTTFGLLYGAANRDGTVFPEPDRFDIRRTPNRHVAFGRGAHLCLGNQLAKLNMRILFQALFDRFETLQLVGDAEFKRGLSTRGLKALDIEVF